MQNDILIYWLKQTEIGFEFRYLRQDYVSPHGWDVMHSAWHRAWENVRPSCSCHASRGFQVPFGLRCPEACRGVTPQCFAELLIVVASDIVFHGEPVLNHVVHVITSKIQSCRLADELGTEAVVTTPSKRAEK